jgi:hypothetical protein
MPAKIKTLEKKYPDLALRLQAEADAEAKSRAKAKAATKFTNRQYPDHSDLLSKAMMTCIEYRGYLRTRSRIYRDPMISRYCASTESMINLESKRKELCEVGERRTLEIDCKRYKDRLLERNEGRDKFSDGGTMSSEYMARMTQRKLELFNEEIRILEELEDCIEEVERECKRFGGVEEWIKWNKKRVMGEEEYAKDASECELEAVE